jgi:hypothetical protein
MDAAEKILNANNYRYGYFQISQYVLFGHGLLDEQSPNLDCLLSLFA